jgi:putative transcriptional regulator
MRELNLPSNDPKSMLPGNLLVASPSVSTQPFARSVILVLEHSPDGAQGVVLNSEANEAMKSWCREMAQQPDKQAVFEQLQEVASSAAELAKEGTSLPFTVCMAKPAETVEEMVDELGHGVRIFVGRVVWEAGQLETEALSGTWMITPASPELVFGDYENLWQTCVRRVGEEVISSASGMRGTPKDVRWN